LDAALVSLKVVIRTEKKICSVGRTNVTDDRHTVGRSHIAKKTMKLISFQRKSPQHPPQTTPCFQGWCRDYTDHSPGCARRNWLPHVQCVLRTKSGSRRAFHDRFLQRVGTTGRIAIPSISLSVTRCGAVSEQLNRSLSNQHFMVIA